MYVCNDRVTECTRVRRVCAAATSVHSGVHLCARSCRIRSACAPRLPLDGWNSRLRYGYHYLVVSAGRRGRGGGGVYGQPRFWLFRIIRSFLNLYLNAKKNSSKNFSCFYIFINWISFPVRKDSLYALARQNR